MSNEDEYKKMRDHYRVYKQEVTYNSYSASAEASNELWREFGEYEKRLLAFCLANGHDAQELNQFFRDVDKELVIPFAYS